jgi:hypothetical protein
MWQLGQCCHSARVLRITVQMVSNGGSQTTLRKPSSPRIFFCGSTDIFYNGKFYIHSILEVGLVVQHLGLTGRLINHIYEINVDKM